MLIHAYDPCLVLSGLSCLGVGVASIVRSLERLSVFFFFNENFYRCNPLKVRPLLNLFAKDLRFTKICYECDVVNCHSGGKIGEFSVLTNSLFSPLVGKIHHCQVVLMHHHQPNFQKDFPKSMEIFWYSDVFWERCYLVSR